MSTASRNAFGHGFWAQLHHDVPASAELTDLAKAICGDEQDPEVFALALKVAENEIMLQAIRTHKIDLVERLREPYAVPLAKKDNTLTLMNVRFMEAWLADREITLRAPVLLDKYKEAMRIALKRGESSPQPPSARNGPTPTSDSMAQEERPSTPLSDQERLARQEQLKGPMLGDLVPLGLRLLLQEPETIDPSLIEAAKELIEERDTDEAMEAAMVDLVRLDRYEQRAWSRKQRAIRQLADFKTMKRFASDAGRQIERTSQ